MYYFSVQHQTKPILIHLDTQRLWIQPVGSSPSIHAPFTGITVFSPMMP